jgi:hypothetical protein
VWGGYPTITNAHHGVGFARVIYVPKRAFAFRRIDSQDLVKFNNRDASASTRSSGDLNTQMPLPMPDAAQRLRL